MFHIDLPNSDIEVPIEDLRWAVYRIPTDQPEADGTFRWDATTMVLVRVMAGGAVGTGWTYGAAAGGALIGELLADVVKGRCALDVTGVYEAMCRAVRNVGRPGVAAMAISAIDTALWDLKARLIGVRLTRLLGAVHEQVPIYGSGGFTTYDEMRLREQMSHWVHELGVPRVKIKIGESWGKAVERDLTRMRQARDAIGADAELYVDANGGYTEKQAIRVADAMADLDVRWFEEPVSSDDLIGLRAVRDAVSPDVTAGEYGYDLPYFQRMCAAGAVDCLQVDVSRCGGITEWLRVCAVAAAHGLQVSGHCAPHLHVDVAAATVNLRHLEWFHDHVRIESLFFDGALVPDGGLLAPDLTVPGNGLEFREADAQRYRVA
ncbi:enolase C-terminal domain-like protein [Micromonospora polyrhachis]|uniref:L-alanine-DL-glutamate epimerase-like enolase superfamily enzyme n=1 Tax=Micromonospora polyrhachis TaxID=1282883 RepID=A0A7W7SX48_9ACTN|nr:enolase C-terminal domain-like protein [Micromonospora polyrhachis]MBB4962541.1 L-alanine-DL-glutamate epimerase-like enolase superfamily enzyme [Micromonospora polyrhachis]